MDVRSSAKVGFVVLLAFALGIGLYLYLSHLKAGTYNIKVDFADTQGLATHSVVRMLGVPVGEVSTVDLDKNDKPIVILSIKDKYRIPTDYTFSVVSGLFTGGAVQINAPKKRQPEPITYFPTDGSAFAKAQPPGGVLGSFSPELQETINNLNKSFAELDDKVNAAYKKIDGILDETHMLMRTANKVANTANGFISDPSVKRTLFATLSNVRDTTADAHMMTTQLRHDLDDLVGSSKGNLKDLETKINNILDHVDDAIQNTNTVVQKLTDQVTDPHLQQSLQETAELARATLARFNQIASDLHELTGDPNLQGALKETVQNVQHLTETIQPTLENINKVVTKVANTTPHGIRIPPITLNANISQQFSPGAFRVDLEARMPFGRNYLVNAGVYDLGHDTRLIAQVGNQITDKLDVRYGLYAGDISAGLDYQLSPLVGFRADLWDSNHTRLDVRTLFRVNKNASLWFGADNLLHDPAPIIGVQLTH